MFLSDGDLNTDKQLNFSLKPTPPFSLELVAWALRRRPENAVDRWDGQFYERVLIVKRSPLNIKVSQNGSPDRPRLLIEATGSRLAPDTKSEVTEAVARLLGIRKDLREFYRLTVRDRKLGSLVERFRGVKPPRFPTVFEALINAIACQQLSLTFGIQLLNRLAQNFGIYNRSHLRAHAFPRPEELAKLKPQSLRRLGFNRHKARAIIELSRAITAGLDLERLAALSDEEAIARLCDLHGVGRWTAEYVLLRGLGRVHVFPGDDVGARNALQRWLGLRKPLDYDRVRRTLVKWKPFAGLIYFHMLLYGLAGRGYFDISL